MTQNPKDAVPSVKLDLKMAERSRLAIPGTAAELKRSRDRDASLAMEEHEANRLAVLATTARLRAERLARLADDARSPTKNNRHKKV